MMLQRISTLAMTLVVIAGCSASASGSPTASAATTPSRSPAATASPAARATPAASPIPAATPAPRPTAEPSPVVLYEVHKNAEGAHGGAPLIALPASIVVDYLVRGTCTFTIDLDTATSTNGPSLKVSVTGPETSGSWHVSIKPGSYYVSVGESVGCTFDVTVGAG